MISIMASINQRFFITIFLLLSFSKLNSQELSSEEKKLFQMITDYRKENGLPFIPLSASLTSVAQLHVKDLVENKPDLGKCNSHSWSSKGKWSACCYTLDNSQAKCMWSKPRELTSYQANGYEIACGSNVCCSDFKMTAEYALGKWKKVLDIIL